MEHELAVSFTPKSLLKFVLPSIVMMMFMSLYTIIDGMFVSRLVGSDALSAINITLPALTLIWAIGIMFATGSGAIISSDMGEGQWDRAKSRFSFIVLVNAIIGVLVMVLGLLFVEPIVVSLGATQNIKQYGIDYLSVLILFTPISIIKMLLDYFIIAAGRPQLAFVLTVLGGIINIILDYVFIYSFQMGIQGAAWATGLGQFIPAIIGILFFTRQANALHFVKPKMEWAMLVKSMLNGSSEMVTNLATGVTTFLFNITMLRLVGEDGVAAMTVVLYAQYLLVSAFLGYVTGIAPVISFKFGEKDTNQLRFIITFSMKIIAIVSVIIFLSSYVLAPVITLLFVDASNPVYEMTVKGFNLFAISFLFCGVNIFVSGMFTAFSNGLISAVISFLRTLVFIVILIMILPRFFDLAGVWLTVPIAELLSLMISLYFMNRYKENYHYAKLKNESYASSTTETN